MRHRVSVSHELEEQFGMRLVEVVKDQVTCIHGCWPAGEPVLRGLTFELSGRRRQDARPGLAKMYRVPPDRAWWPAVGAPLERGVRPHCAGRMGAALDS